MMRHDHAGSIVCLSQCALDKGPRNDLAKILILIGRYSIEIYRLSRGIDAI